jgi:predicted O-methyltransferase YrrM
MKHLRRAYRDWTKLRRALDATRVRHAEASVIASADDDARPTKRLLDVALGAANRARSVEFRIFSGRPSKEPRWFEIWPGEHYKLLAGLVAELGARRVIEIGATTGMGTLALSEALPADGQVTIFGPTPWRDFPDTWLAEKDFATGRIRQEVADLASPEVIARFSEAFETAEFILIDGPRDPAAYPKLIEALASIGLPNDPIVIFDNVRALDMIEAWRGLARPKLDLTSFGHWSGTGLVDWNA